MSSKKFSTTVYIDPDQLHQLNALKAATKVSVAELIRQGVELVLAQEEAKLVVHEIWLHPDTGYGIMLAKTNSEERSELEGLGLGLVKTITGTEDEAKRAFIVWSKEQCPTATVKRVDLSRLLKE